MPNGYGRGFGFRGSSPPWPYVGRGRGGMPRCRHPGAFAGPAYRQAGWAPYPFPGPRVAPFGPGPTRQEELDLLKAQAEALKGRIEGIEGRIRELEED